VPLVLFMTEYYDVMSVALSFTIIQFVIFLLLVISTLKLLYPKDLKN